MKQGQIMNYIRSAFITLLLFGLVQIPCAGASQHANSSFQTSHINLSPIFYEASNPQKHTWVIEILGPFLTFYHQSDKSGWLFRPFFSWDHQKKSKDFYYLYPLGRWETTGNETSWRLTPLFRGESNEKKQTGSSYDKFFWPVFWGRNKTGQFYWGIFPIYGNIYNRFGRDKITFFLWPLYAHSTWDKNSQLTLLWPFYSKFSGPDEQGIKLWPFYEHLTSPGNWEKGFIMWPFFFRKKDLKDPKYHEWMFLPFYAVQYQGEKTSRTFLWPFFRVVKDPEEDYLKVEAPWPFFTYTSGKNIFNIELWPIIGHKKTPEDSSNYFLWYVFSRDALKTKKQKLITWRLLLFSKLVYREDLKGNEVYVKRRIWPLFNYINVDNKDYWFAFPELNPFDIKKMDQMYGSIFHLIEIKRTPHTGYTKILWGLYRHYWNPKEDYLALTFLFSKDQTPCSDRWTILGGLFGEQWKHGRKQYIIFFEPTSWWGSIFHLNNHRHSGTLSTK